MAHNLLSQQQQNRYLDILDNIRQLREAAHGAVNDSLTAAMNRTFQALPFIVWGLSILHNKISRNSTGEQGPVLLYILLIVLAVVIQKTVWQRWLLPKRMRHVLTKARNINAATVAGLNAWWGDVGTLLDAEGWGHLKPPQISDAAEPIGKIPGVYKRGDEVSLWSVQPFVADGGVWLVDHRGDVITSSLPLYFRKL